MFFRLVRCKSVCVGKCEACNFYCIAYIVRNCCWCSSSPFNLLLVAVLVVAVAVVVVVVVVVVV